MALDRRRPSEIFPEPYLKKHFLGKKLKSIHVSDSGATLDFGEAGAIHFSAELKSKPNWTDHEAAVMERLDVGADLEWECT